MEYGRNNLSLWVERFRFERFLVYIFYIILFMEFFLCKYKIDNIRFILSYGRKVKYNVYDCFKFFLK